MSGGYICKCEEASKPIFERAWRVVQYRCNHSAFNGYHYTPSAYSAIVCDRCHSSWRTTAPYADTLAARDLSK